MNTVIIICAVFIGCVAVIIAEYINKIKKEKKKVNVSFKEAMDLTELPVVTFINNDKKINFLLDTGSNMSQINSSVLKSLDLKYSMTNRGAKVTGMEGNAREVNLCTMFLTYKNKVFIDDFQINDLDRAFNMIKRETGVQIHGILGSLFFKKYKYVLDFNELIAYSMK